uniref:Uncharacterized protein n=1 Tax=Klebsiella pneumoniae TaxID=573 RepID=A0A8B0SUT8_KLEPN|nr:hypothetical protein [Klebsiella pneumoniae]
MRGYVTPDQMLNSLKNGQSEKNNSPGATMKKLIAVAAVVVVSFAAQSSVCGPVACKVTFVDVDGSQKADHASR